MERIGNIRGLINATQAEKKEATDAATLQTALADAVGGDHGRVSI